MTDFYNPLSQELLADIKWAADDALNGGSFRSKKGKEKLKALLTPTVILQWVAMTNAFGDNTKRVEVLQKRKYNLQVEMGMATGERHKALGLEIDSLLNEIYDAVFELQAILKKQTGVSAHKFPDLLRDFGYVIGGRIELPKHVNANRD